jgi:nitroreductase
MSASTPQGTMRDAALGELTGLIRDRRTNLRVDPQRAVPGELVEQLCELVTWAPNHKRTEPWRFVVFSGAGRAKLGDAFESSQIADGVTDDGKLAKARTKYGRAPVVVAVIAAGDDNPMRRDENRDAVAAGIQNMLLGATAAGLASFWSTGGATVAAGVRALCQCTDDEQIIGLIYLGWPLDDAPVAVPGRAPARITHHA